ncbi:MAG: hydantoinase/oxoprolinase family protein [Acidobacteriia bacterium]|nr:hydantoinase/oxoprolinase family protein [Terriglobia bacterium]
MSYRLAVDVGGTFTDLLLFNEKAGELVLAKTPSTPADPSVGVLTGIHKIAAKAGIDPNEIMLILHGTTVATNAVLEGKGARVGLLTNKGFEQILHVARGQTPGPLAGWIIMIKPDPLAPLELTRGLSARMSARGEVQTPVDEKEVRAHISELHKAGIEALTVSLINSYANHTHEQQVKKIVQEMYPDLPVTASTDILPEFREYERTLTTVMNSYLRPKMRVYLDGMKQKLKESKLKAPMHIVRSDGGVMSIEAAAERPANTLLSGPSGGGVASAYLGALAGFSNVLSFDMGGTSTDVALSRGGKPNVVRDTRVGQYPIKVPSLDVHTVGAGGGSIAHVPLTGALRVGPQSAGAEPGPAAYGKGGSEPTVTDANIVLGYLPPTLLGGEMTLDESLSGKAVQKIADAMGLSLHVAAEGIYNIVNENMFGALRLVSVQRGYDPREFALVGLGGAGPLHANALSILIGSWPSIIPPMPGVLSAQGFLHSDIKSEFSRTVIRPVSQIDLKQMRATLETLGEQAREWLNSEHIATKHQKIQFQIDMRYYRQGYEFSIDVEPGWLDSPAGVQRMIEKFRQIHYQNYSFNIDHEVEVVNLRAVAIGVVPKVEIRKHKKSGQTAAKARSGSRKIYFRGKWINAAVYDRAGLGAGCKIEGPAIVTQSDTTTLILPGHIGEVDQYLNILIWPKGKRAASRGKR